uniref:choice-of-anchor U domain-containing protein n=1 Tax=Thermus islandicus TaxID=540988 RepID=UPI001FE1A936
MRKGTRYGLLAGLALLLAACGGQSGSTGGGGSSGTVNTPGGQVQATLQGGTFTQRPTAQSVTPPQGFQAPYGAIAFTAQVAQGGTLTVSLTFPQAIPAGAVLMKYLNNNWQPVPNAQISGNTATYKVQDGGPLDADGQANGQVVDPVALLVSSGGGGGGSNPSFTLSLNPTILTVQQGSSGTTTLTVTPQNGFTGTVSLSLVGAPSGVSLSPTSVSVSGSNPVTQALTLAVASSVAPGTYNLQVKGTAGSLSAQASLSLTVSAPAGIAWTLRTSGGHSLYDVTYGNGLFVAVGSPGAILTSPDGQSWTARKSGTTNQLNGVTYGNGTFVAVGEGGTILTSTDGVTW